MRILVSVLLVLSSVMGVSLRANAQIVAPVLENKAFEGGYAYKWFERDISAPQGAEWEAASLFARFGAREWLTIAAEAGLWDIDGNAPASEYSRWVIGGAVSARIYQAQRFAVTATVTYNEVFDHDETENNSDKRTRGWNAGVLAGTSLATAGQRLDLWAGPMFVDDRIESYPFGLDEPVSYEPDTKLGGAAGLYAVLFDYVSGFAYVLYADNPQWRLGISLRSRGSSE